MARDFGTELLRGMAPRLKAEFEVQPYVPLEIKLRLERLKLSELIRAVIEERNKAAPEPEAQLQKAS